MIRARKVLMWFLIAFAVYAIFKSPDQAADIVRSAFNGLADLIGGVGQFFDELLAG